MGLMKPPNIFTFLVAVTLVIVAVVSHAGVVIPGVGPVVGGHEFWLLLGANILFILGTVTRGF